MADPLATADRADRAAAAHDVVTAAALYREAIARSPATAPPLTLRLALMLLAAERVRSALDVLRGLNAAAPTSASAWQTLGAALRHAGDPAAADHAFLRALALAPHFPLAKLARAQVAADLGRPSEALFDAALAADPASGPARLAAAAAQASAGWSTSRGYATRSDSSATIAATCAPWPASASAASRVGDGSAGSGIASTVTPRRRRSRSRHRLSATVCSHVSTFARGSQRGAIRHSRMNATCVTSSASAGRAASATRGRAPAAAWPPSAGGSPLRRPAPPGRARPRPGPRSSGKGQEGAAAHVTQRGAEAEHAEIAVATSSPLPSTPPVWRSVAPRSPGGKKKPERRKAARGPFKI